jgi:hypothetical protein
MKLRHAGPALAAALGVAHLGLLAYVMIGRMAYPFDLEWMEGGMLCHALRLMEGKPIYGPPSAEFISYLYTPFYPFVVAVLGKAVGLSYFLGRLVSVLSFAVALALVYRLVARRAGGGLSGRLWAIAALGLIASSFPQVGAWYDLVRNDSLYLVLTVGFLYLVRDARGGWRRLVAAGVLAGLAFLTKQTASLFIVLSGMAVLLHSWRRFPVYVAVVGLVAGGSVLLLNWLSHGWFWRYAFGMHQGHDLYWDRIWPVTELKLLRFSPAVAGVMGLWLLLRPAIWIRERGLGPEGRRTLFWFAVALTGVAVSAVGFSTQWASENAYIPGLVFPGLFAVLAAADLTRQAGGAAGRERPVIGGIAALLLGGVLAAQMALQLYRPGPHIPTARDRRTGDELLATLRRARGPVLLPYHPFYAVRAGERPSYHQMGINDVTRAGHPFPSDILDRVGQRSYRAVLLDNPPRGRYDFLLGPYKLGRYFRGDEVPQVVTGYAVRPTYLFVPKEPDPVPDGARRVFGFEDGTYVGWSVEGTAFGGAPAGGPLWDQGPVGPFEGSYLASSYHGGDAARGTLTSAEFEVDRPYLSYRIGGGPGPDTAVRLLVDSREVHRGTGPGSDIMELRRVDVGQHVGRRMRVQLVDRATGAWGHLLFDDLTLQERLP